MLRNSAVVIQEGRGCRTFCNIAAVIQNGGGCRHNLCCSLMDLSLHPADFLDGVGVGIIEGPLFGELVGNDPMGIGKNQQTLHQ